MFRMNEQVFEIPQNGVCVLERSMSCDVLVLGSGIAGVSAALDAAEAGCDVVLACQGQLFSGSSFYPGTWGLGLIGPDGSDDEEDLARTIMDVGCGVADPELVRTLVGGIAPAIQSVRERGVKLRRAAASAEREFIPCFDHKHRDWNGIEFESFRQVMGAEIERLGICVLPGWQALELVKRDGAVCGAAMFGDGALHYVSAKAVVLATGGYGSLFKYHLCTEDVQGVGQGLALQAGAQLVNMEFMQMMLGHVSPAPKTIFNEKVYRFAEFRAVGCAGSPATDCVGSRDALSAGAKSLLDARSGHGPFTSRLETGLVDRELYRAFLADDRGVEVTYSEEMKQNPPEFVCTYFDWLKDAKGLTWDDPVRVGLFAHAANGGVRIDSDAWTGVPGLFAAGEVTGGMHGADRIGGLSTANGLVFGGIAGRSAAKRASELDADSSLEGVEAPPLAQAPVSIGFDCFAVPEAKARFAALQDLMYRNAMCIRTEEGLTSALAAIREMRAEVDERREPAANAADVAYAYGFLHRLNTAEAVVSAALARPDSLGSHYRE